MTQKQYKLEFLIYYPDGDYPEFVTEIEKQTNRLTTVKKAIEPFNPNTGQYKVCFTGIDKDVDALNTRIRNHFESFVPLNDELGDDLRIKAYPILSRIEQSLRRFFSLCLPDENHFDLQRDGGLKMYPAHKELPVIPRNYYLDSDISNDFEYIYIEDKHCCSDLLNYTNVHL